MNKKLWTLLVLLTVCVFCLAAGAEEAGVKIDKEHFPDKAFRNAVSEYDLDWNGILSEEEAKKAVSIILFPGDTETLRGVEYLTGLEELSCPGNKLTELDVSRNVNLKVLSCNNNRLTKLDVSSNPKLENLYCAGNQLTELDVRANPELRELDFSGNRVSGVDISRNTRLTWLNCSDNLVLELEISAPANLTGLGIAGYPIQEIDCSIYPELTFLDCSHCGLKKLDVSRNPKLEFLECGGNELTRLDLSNNPGLISVQCEENRLTELNLSNNPRIRYLVCSGNRIESLDISGCRELAYRAGKSEPVEEEGILKWKGRGYGRTELYTDKGVELYTGVEKGTEAKAEDSAAGISGDTPVYWVPEDGKYYHLDPDCMASWSLEYCCTYAELGQEPYCRLLPCEACSAPLERAEETGYANFGDAYTGAISGTFGRTCCVTAVRKGEDYYRVVAKFDETAKALLAEQFEIDYEQDQDRYMEVARKYFEYCNTLPVSYEEKITAVPLSREERDALKGKHLGELLHEGFWLTGHHYESNASVFELQYGFYAYSCFVHTSPEVYEEHAEEENFNDLIVDDLSVKGLSQQAFDLTYRPDGTRFTEDLTNP